MSRPHLHLGRHLLPGVVALALFAVLAVAFVGAPLGDPAGIDAGVVNETNLTATAPSDVDVANATFSSENTDEGTVLVLTQQRDGNATEVYRVTMTNQSGAEITRENRGGAVYAVARSGSVTENLGYSMFDMGGLQFIPGESFLVAFEIVDVVLVAALVAAVMLARRDSGSGVKTALSPEDDETATDGGREQGGED